ncbi:hypothetical protein COV24_04935 [candidate division WWE3 bacterium CG10_big_fil_rev_8_21_14_0_10_32_10]|uniref:Uncharacterized protein n=1 Tax=candidate division WWE3 bacterium CG10_big_fil_rev_8_21_14_0_10_32_10 TaxID=1975090 RepID=A0A2H0R8W3_UNCKA|nr:MAG: hypothetical protein COV24_04935 [candidate division WWE3 bacterium CG10_big_fil_rev_8_21_14_0_10_32_10]
MTIKAKILTNTLYQLLAKFVSTAGTLLITIIITRILGAVTWGEYSIVISYTTFFYIFTEFGLNSIAARDFSSKKRVGRSDFYNFLFVRGIHTLIIITLGMVVLGFMHYPTYINKAIYLSQISVLFFSLSSGYNALFQSKLLYKYLFIITCVFSIINLFLFLFVVNFIKINLIYLFIPTVLSDLIRFIFATVIANKVLEKDKIILTFHRMKYFFFMAIPLGVALIFNTLMTQIDRLMLSVMSQPVFVGYYSLSYKLFDVLLVLPTFFMNAAFTIFVKKHASNQGYNKELTLSMYALGLISFFITIVALTSGWFFIPLIWGQAMKPAVSSFNILISGSILFFLSSPLSWIFVVENKIKYLVYFYTAGFIMNFVLNIFAIKMYGYNGAAVTTIITELFVLIILEIYRRKKLNVKYTSYNPKELFNLINLNK